MEADWRFLGRGAMCQAAPAFAFRSPVRGGEQAALLAGTGRQEQAKAAAPSADSRASERLSPGEILVVPAGTRVRAPPRVETPPPAEPRR